MSLRLLITHTIARNVTVICQHKKKKDSYATRQCNNFTLWLENGKTTEIGYIYIYIYIYSSYIFLLVIYWKYAIEVKYFIKYSNVYIFLYTNGISNVLSNISENFAKYSCEYCFSWLSNNIQKAIKH